MYEVGTPVKVKVLKSNNSADYYVLRGLVVDVDEEDLVDEGRLTYIIQLTEAVDGLKVGFRFEAGEDQVKAV